MHRSHAIAPLRSCQIYWADALAVPLITAVYRPRLGGWRQLGDRKRVSRSWLLGARVDGVTVVQLSLHGRLADFTVAELLSRSA